MQGGGIYMNVIVAIFGLGYGTNGTLGSQTEVALKQGVSVWKWLVECKTSPTLICSGMAIISGGSNPPVTQEDLMAAYVKAEGASSLFAQKTEETLALYNKTWGNAIEIVDMAIKNHMDTVDVYLVDHPTHLPRLKMALQWMSRLAHYKGLRFIGNPTEVDTSNQAQWVAKSAFRFWLYEKAVTVFQVLWLLSHSSKVKKHFEKVYQGVA